MAPGSKWWTLCVVSLSCVAPFGSCTSHRTDGAQPELFIFNELCALKDNKGPCKAIKDRFFFNIDTGRCEQFEYGGCGGNANNFLTLEACEEMCVVSADKNPCHLAEAPGPCRGLVTRYFFDSESQECKHFFYGGCFGNANNFRSMAECQAKCMNPVKTTKAPEVISAEPTRESNTQPLKVTGEVAISQPQVQLYSHQQPTDFRPPEFCMTPIDRGTCDGAERRFAYNPNTKRCHMFRYSGCEGNKNNFTHRRHCMKVCMNIRSKDHGMKMIRIRKKNINNIAFHSV
ncbi:tissue factor pathway inhibitor a isoform X2 [Myripristis murdjan]|uniref:tissue factor pathway inhibitor a isoform X2 n=1 Tax=Myripristis murdjan TaxID=586833 RepID=UPI0011763405|nr:tissue factor pathway inhibitor-like isoform X2 [Myripristis murdjan]